MYVGAVLYFLCTGETLFHCNCDDDITDQDQLLELFEFSQEFKKKRLSKISDNLCRNAISQLLVKDPLLRPTMARFIHHPFVSGRKAARYIYE
jgi:serine/threonine protein kinase